MLKCYLDPISQKEFIIIRNFKEKSEEKKIIMANGRVSPGGSYKSDKSWHSI